MQTTREYITIKGETKMVSLTIGISNELELKITDTQEGLQHGNIRLVDARLGSLVNNNAWEEFQKVRAVLFRGKIIKYRNIEIAQKEMRATANAFAHLADLLDAEEKND